MRRTNHSKYGLGTLFCSVWLLIIATASAHGSVKLQLRNGRPIVDGVYINDHGPFRFLLDTGSNINLIDASLAGRIGLVATSHVELASAAGRTSAGQSDGNHIVLDTAAASDQRFLISSLDAIHASSPDVQGVLGNWFLARFDFLLDFQSRILRFTDTSASGDLDGLRVGIHLVNLRPVLSTSLGNLVLDSGQDQVVLFGVHPDDDREFGYQLRTVAGGQLVGKSPHQRLTIAGKTIWSGDAVAISARPEPEIDGLLPLNIFKALYICNSGGYVTLR